MASDARQLPLFAPVGVHDVDPVAGEGDPPPVGRPGRTPSCPHPGTPPFVSLRCPLPSAFMT